MLARKSPPGRSFAAMFVDRQTQVVVIEQMRQRVVAGEDDVELAGDRFRERSQIGNTERERGAAARASRSARATAVGLRSVAWTVWPSSASPIACVPMPQAQSRMACGPGPSCARIEPIERGGLAPHRRLPIGKDEVVALGQFVVERAHRVVHWRIEPVSKLHRTRRFVAASGAKPTVRASTSE